MYQCFTVTSPPNTLAVHLTALGTPVQVHCTPVLMKPEEPEPYLSALVNNNKLYVVYVVV
jgi:hypothetical protein